MDAMLGELIRNRSLIRVTQADNGDVNLAFACGFCICDEELFSPANAEAIDDMQDMQHMTPE